MEDHCSSHLCSTYLFQDEGIEELRHCMLYITELEATIIAAKEEITRREIEILNLKYTITKTIQETHEAEQESKNLFLENAILQQQQQQLREQDTTSSEEDEFETLPEIVLKERALPEKGKLLEAVKEAGPLLHTLLLAGHLPQWQHPPPPLHSIDIIPPPSFTLKRPLEYSSDPSTPSNKFQKVTLL
ncbi:hypothetical protein M5689_001545 [Euphorbia peplus]|nr:hypothetical protein M5689_001545 [Euphorbia peplus]